MINKLDMKTMNMTNVNIEKLNQLFPNCIVEVEDKDGNLVKSVDFDLLKQELSEQMIDSNKEKYTLNWPGKKNSLILSNSPITKTLRPIKDDSVSFESTKNIYIDGDNLDALKILQDSYLNKIKLIYIDPPYNTGKDFLYQDNFSTEKEIELEMGGQNDEYGNRLLKNQETNGRFHSDWLSMIYSRIKLARNLLTNDGVIFISISEEEFYNLRRICNDIFGENNFRNTFIVRRHDKNINTQFAENGLKTLNVAYEYIVCYSKSDKFLFKAVYKEASTDRQEKGYWKGFWNDADRPTMRYDLLGFTPENGQWKWKAEVAHEAVLNYQEYLEKYSKDMTLEEYWEKTGKKKKFIKRNNDGKGKNQGVEHWIAPSIGILRNTNLLDFLATKQDENIKNLFDYPKNIDLIKLICEMANVDYDDIVLDFFSGSATTAHAVMQLNAEDGGNRRFIMVQIPEEIDEKSEAYKAGYKTICEIGKERIRRAGTKILEENKDKEGIENLDIGFRVFKVDSSNMKDVYYNPDEIRQDNLFDMVSNIKEDRTDLDLLFQVLLDSGVELTLPIEEKQIAGKKVYFVDGNVLAACFEDNLTEEFVTELAKCEDLLKVVFRDSSFGSDDSRINVEQIFKQYSPDTQIRVI